jgi:hypothetical protein
MDVVTNGGMSAEERVARVQELLNPKLKEF